VLVVAPDRKKKQASGSSIPCRRSAGLEERSSDEWLHIYPIRRLGCGRKQARVKDDGARGAARATSLLPGVFPSRPFFKVRSSRGAGLRSARPTPRPGSSGHESRGPADQFISNQRPPGLATALGLGDGIRRPRAVAPRALCDGAGASGPHRPLSVDVAATPTAAATVWCHGDQPSPVVRPLSLSRDARACTPGPRPAIISGRRDWLAPLGAHVGTAGVAFRKRSGPHTQLHVTGYRHETGDLFIHHGPRRPPRTERELPGSSTMGRIDGLLHDRLRDPPRHPSAGLSAPAAGPPIWTAVSDVTRSRTRS